MHSAKLDEHCRVMIAHELAHVGCNHLSEAVLSMLVGFLGTLSLQSCLWLHYASRGASLGRATLRMLPISVLCGVVALRYSQRTAELRADHFASRIVGVEATVRFLRMLVADQTPKPSHARWWEAVVHFFGNSHPSTEDRVRSVLERSRIDCKREHTQERV
jgi:Zn-dependent protease with chaperone function